MASLNKVMLIGNITRDPELRYTPKGSPVLEIGMAMNRRYRVEEEVREEVTFADVVFYGKQAEVIAQYCKKGNPLFVEGRLQLDTWEDKQTGQKKSRTRVVGENFQLLGGRPSGGASEGGGASSGGGFRSGQQPARPAAPARPSGPTSQPVSESPPYDDEEQIPF